MTSRAGSPTATPKAPLSMVLRFSLKDAIASSFLGAVDEGGAGNRIQHQFLERPVLLLKERRQNVERRLVGVEFATAHRVAIELFHDARLEVARADEQIGETGRAVE